MNLNDRMKFLVKEINKHNYNYYVLDNPTISDKQWDIYYDELLELEKTTGIVLPGSPTKNVGDNVLKGFKKVSHLNRLYSLDKCNNKESLKKWYDGIIEKLGPQQFSVECKFDGLQMTVTYENGVLVNAATRGNGFIGEDVTEQAKTISSVPHVINTNDKVVVQGEAMMKLSVLSEYNKNSTDLLKNARNAAAGAIRNLNPEVTKKRKLNMFFYGVIYNEGQKLNSQKEVMEFLKQNGFEVYNLFEIVDNFDDLSSIIDKIDKMKSSLDVLLDGAVVKLNDVSLRDELGYTSKFPKWAMAYKFEAVELVSKLVNVVWQVGRTGKVTPIAEIDPVELAGATVKRATLNNFGDITRKDIKLNSTVFVRRSNEVIPEILGVAEHFKDSVSITKPVYCPTCGSKLVEEGANLFCRNSELCTDQIEDKLIHFASKNAMNIVGINTKIAEQLRTHLGIVEVVDLYGITKDELLGLDKFKDKKADNIISEIEKSKKVKLSNFIYALSILNVGEKTSKDLSKHFKTLDNLMNASISELISINEVGEVIAKNVYDYFNNSKNIQLINRLKENGVVIEDENNSLYSTNKYFSGKTVVITGVLSKYSRSELTAILENFGANTSSSVSANTDYLIVGESAGSKYDKAIKLGVEIINEEQLEKMLK